MDSHLPVIEVVTFRANQSCKDDPALFNEVREIVATTTSVKAMYWGRSVEFPSTFIWLLLWDTLAQSRAREATPSHANMVRKLDALIDSSKSKTVIHVHFPDHPPLACIEAPVTEFDISIFKDSDRANVPQFERTADSIVANIKALRLEGFRSASRGKALENELINIYIIGWDSIEEHMKLGTQESHQSIVKESEEYIHSLRDLQLQHVHFERHA